MSIAITKTVAEHKADFEAVYAAAKASGDDTMLAQAWTDLSQGVAATIIADYKAMTEEERSDHAALAQRGVRQLTGAEVNYYTALATAMRSNGYSVKAALDSLDVVMPESIIDQVMEDVKSDFPLLDAIDFVNASYLTTWLYNKQGVQTATWGTIGGKVLGELSGAFGKLSTTQCKLTAYMVVSKDYLDLGPAWLDRYVRAILTEAMGMAMEAAIVDGSGNADGADCPIGMTRNLDAGTVADSLTTYARKTAIEVTALDPETYGKVLATLAKTPTGRDRKVTGLIMVVNPTDYFTKVMPATTYMTPNGGYVNGVLPVPTQIIQSVACPEGYAVVGMGKQYIGLMGVGSKKGTITYDDSVQFLEDNRVYKSRLIGNGLPKDNTSFALLNISNLEPLTYKVTQAE